MGTGISNFTVQFMPLFRRKDEYEQKQAQEKKKIRKEIQKMPDSRIGEIQFKCFATQKLMFFQVISKNLELQPTLCGKPQKLGSKEKM